jgi:hypothetical protein
MLMLSKTKFPVFKILIILSLFLILSVATALD